VTRRDEAELNYRRRHEFEKFALVLVGTHFPLEHLACTLGRLPDISYILYPISYIYTVSARWRRHVRLHLLHAPYKQSC
jgi:hypothetical protein